MKTLILFLTIIIFSTTNAYSAMDCENVKKTSPKYLLCKTGSGLSSIKNKSDKKSIFKKFGEAKSLSDLTK